MSKLDSFIRRMQAQQACINMACQMIDPVPGAIFELGLGSGRTYSHLCEKLPQREIYVFDRAVSAHAVCTPPPDRLRLGELTDTLPVAVNQFCGQVALIHIDIGAADRKNNTQLAEFISTHLSTALAVDAVVLSDQQLYVPHLDTLALPDGVAGGRYFMYRDRRRRESGSSTTPSAA